MQAAWAQQHQDGGDPRGGCRQRRVGQPAGVRLVRPQTAQRLEQPAEEHARGGQDRGEGCCGAGRDHPPEHPLPPHQPERGLGALGGGTGWRGAPEGLQDDEQAGAGSQQR